MKRKIPYTTIIAGTFLFVGIFLSFYFANSKKKELEKNGVTTVGITYDCTLVGNGGSLIYFYKAGGKIFRGAMTRGNADCPGAYYQVIYSSEKPELSNLLQDVPYPDSIGRNFILMSEIDPENYENK